MQINGAGSSLFPPLFPNQAQPVQASATHREVSESGTVESLESGKTQIAEGESVQPTRAASSTQPGRLSIYV